MDIKSLAHVPGHELAGVVAEVGSGTSAITNFSRDFTISMYAGSSLNVLGGDGAVVQLLEDGEADLSGGVLND